MPRQQQNIITARQGKATGKVLSGQCREIIYNVFQFFTSEKSVGGPIIPLENVLERVVAASGVSLKNVTAIAARSTSIDINELNVDDPSSKKIKLESDESNHEYGKHFLIEPLCIVKEEPECKIEIDETDIKKELIDECHEKMSCKSQECINKEGVGLVTEENSVWIKEEIPEEIE